ncbi:Transcriptional regulator, TetR family [Labilithrix luteola]|uniref:Transcriptional regulator, TetR family n=1 Tax=Labilithrix luteola TaxID=1391654 RepID=A0A0K1Q2A9_9BACT|nr:TetR family transcriptional regulator [Labilithrix luteola]AKU99867.1 Transcriptional regulator, TetR family [Labilithrix luteola]
MTESSSTQASATRARILRAALKEFSTRGYHATSVRTIAENVGISKAAVLYHFPGKPDLLGALAEPMLDALEATIGAADLADPEDVKWTLLEGILDVWLAHRYLLRTNLQDLAMVAASPIFKRFRQAMLRANNLVAGADADLADRVRAAQAIGMLADPVVLFVDADPEILRTTILDGVHKLVGGHPRRRSGRNVPPRATSAPARARRPSAGRPPSLTTAMIDEARRLHAAGRTAEDIALELGVSRATVYRHLGAR